MITDRQTICSTRVVYVSTGDVTSLILFGEIQKEEFNCVQHVPKS